MAASKKQIAEWQARIDQAELIAALRWTEPVAPDVPPPPSGGHTEGWMLSAWLEGARAERGWSEFGAHGTGKYDRHRAYGCASKDARHLHSSKLRALRAGRHELATIYARKLMELDRAIAAAAAEEEAARAQQ